MTLPKLMGILNVTPDSFSDGGDISKEAVLKKAASLLEDGADIIDVGAESTRPGATPLTPEEEWLRLESVLPEIMSLAHSCNKRVSLDTRHYKTAAKAMALDVDIINDVSGCTDPQMLSVLSEGTCQLICMHSLTIPADKSVTLPDDADIIEEVTKFIEGKLREFEQHGISKNRVIFDPGIGFAKSAQQSIEILRHIEKLKKINLALLVGHSRKSFLAEFTNVTAEERDALTLAVSQYLLQHSVDILRVHNVKLHHELFQLIKALHASG